MHSLDNIHLSRSESQLLLTPKVTLGYWFLDFCRKQDVLSPKKMCERKYPQKQVIKGNIKGPWAISAQTRKMLVQPDPQKTSSKNRSWPLHATTTTPNLLDFVAASSRSIEDALLPKKKRNRYVRKYIQKRVKRLNDKQLKPVTALTKTTDLPAYSSSPWPTYPYARSKTSQYQGPPSNSELAITELGSLPSSELVGFDGSPPIYSVADSNSKTIDTELDSGFNNEQVSEASSYRSQSAVESQVYLTEHLHPPPIFESEFKDNSDDLFDDIPPDNSDWSESEEDTDSYHKQSLHGFTAGSQHAYMEYSNKTPSSLVPSHISFPNPNLSLLSASNSNTSTPNKPTRGTPQFFARDRTQCESTCGSDSRYTKYSMC